MLDGQVFMHSTVTRPRGEGAMPITASLSAGQEYQPFPDVPRRNLLQESIELPVLIALLRLPRGGRILEVGCGRGIALPVLARTLAPSHLVGIDIDAALLQSAAERAEKRGVQVELRRADVRALPFADGAFDMVIDFGTCHHISGPDRALREIARVLRHGGLFVSETVSSQLLSHPMRTRGRRLPWHAVPGLRVARQAILWKARRKELPITRPFSRAT
jgi:ubiquinone/menaquinone biosynthesis C-methylase UbiE